MGLVALQGLLEIGELPFGSASRVALQPQRFNDFELASYIPMALRDGSLNP
jgi:hypothetical protein